MARLVWIGVGAVGGIYAYRGGTRVVGAVREQGVAGVAQIVAGSAMHSLASLVAAQDPPAPEGTAPRGPAMDLRVGRYRITRTDAAPGARQAVPPRAPAAIMDIGVVDITDAGATRSDPARRRKAR